jgi:hypothetical protein
MGVSLVSGFFSPTSAFVPSLSLLDACGCSYEEMLFDKSGVVVVVAVAAAVIADDDDDELYKT